MSALVPFLVILVMVTVNALYVAAEFATVGSRRSRVQEAAEGGNGAAVTLLGILRDPQRLDNYVAACQIGITLSSLVAGSYGQAQLTPRMSRSKADGMSPACISRIATPVCLIASLRSS